MQYNICSYRNICYHNHQATYSSPKNKNDPSSIGQAVSHGCFRMYNRDVLELSRIVSIGTPVVISS
ncbi:L,D-transpeptidase [Heliobacterium chlorum]|uniref:L,D-transpeptidase n=1 Tax=Heliobacterium chlorum TaxID=2698 RepID=A0ABR7SZU5_HELCL|nr:L,D-transpeptidase [Heliobacterium chlorum]